MELRDYGRQHFPIATFYDSNDIAAGQRLEKEIIANVAESAMIVIHTDTYSDDRGVVRRSSPPSDMDVQC